MTAQRLLLGTYRGLLHLYPASFRKRFGGEMLEVAEAAEASEWPLIFGDTSSAIVRCWIEGSPSTAALADPNAYHAVGESTIPFSRVFQGAALSGVILLVAYCVLSLFPGTSLCSGAPKNVPASCCTVQTYVPLLPAPQVAQSRSK
ncbi:MAG TPA: hypothetical protein VH640_12060 [Bryobacteraceae bacterium]|jgi:hypothetical protein